MWSILMFETILFCFIVVLFSCDETIHYYDYCMFCFCLFCLPIYMFDHNGWCMCVFVYGMPPPPCAEGWMDGWTINRPYPFLYYYYYYKRRLVNSYDV